MGGMLVLEVPASQLLVQLLADLETETFWFDVQLRNPLNADVTLSNLTVVVEDAQEGGIGDEADVEAIEELVLEALETRTVIILLRLLLARNRFLTM